MVYDKEREGMHKADKVVTVSEFTKKIIVDHYGVNAEKVSVVHNGNTSIADVESKRLLPLMRFKHDGKKVILYAGRLTIQKGVDYFVRAARKVLDYEKNVHFIIAGTGDMEQQIKELVCNLGMATDVTFTGFYSVDEQKTLFKLADLVVMPSVSEPFGIIPLESMTTGTPVIVSKQSGVSEVITHGLKVDFWDTDEIANKILAVIRHPSLQETLQKEGYSQASGITWDKAAKKLKHIYQTIT
jgi:glycosyltransferase involved in cell wall biosynthesis